MDAQELLLTIWRWVYGFLYVVYLYLDALYRQFVPPPMKSIDGETILVTGAGGGIGKEMCREIVKNGSNLKLVLWDLSQAEADKLAKELKQMGKGIQVFPFGVDISTKENVKAAAKLVKDTVGPVTILFNNAGIARFLNLLDHSDEEIEMTYQINLMSHLWILREFMPDMVLKNHGRIVTTCSIAGVQASPFAIPYVSSKHAVEGYVESLKLELLLYKYDGIKCTTIYPYFVQTPLIKSLKLMKSDNGGLPGPFQFVLKPSDVAMKAVEGMRREYEHVYLPSIIPIAVVMQYFMPNKLRKMIQETFATAAVFADEKEHKRIFTPYHLQMKNGKVDSS